MFYTERLMLRAIDPEADTATLLQWRNDVDYRYAMNMEAPQPANRGEVKKFIAAFLERDTGLPVFAICEKPTQPLDQLTQSDDIFLLDGKARHPMIGILNFHVPHKLSPTNRVSSFGIAFDRAHQGAGYGTEVIRWMLQYAFNILNLHKVKLTVAGYNERARKCYEKIGFIHEGRSRSEYFKDGKWEDEIMMGMLREDWVELQSSHSLIK